MVKAYTDEWKGFQLREPQYLDGHFEPYKFDLVKWVDHEPYEYLDLKTGEKKMLSRHCFSIGQLIWNPKEPCFEFKSCGLRYLEYREDGLEEWLLKWCAWKEFEYICEEDS